MKKLEPLDLTASTPELTNALLNLKSFSDEKKAKLEIVNKDFKLVEQFLKSSCFSTNFYEIEGEKTFVIYWDSQFKRLMVKSEQLKIKKPIIEASAEIREKLHPFLMSFLETCKTTIGKE